MNIDDAHLKGWVGRAETLTDVVALQPLRGLAALLDRPFDEQAGDELPMPAHWLYFLSAARQSELGEDGHPRRGGFLPPVPLPRRMWAGSRIEFHQTLRVGQEISRTSRIAAVSSKQGRSGALVFVRVSHEIHSGGVLAITEEQDIVYRDTPQAGAAPASTPAPIEPTWTREISPDPVLLFRYSALMFNAHRIHYDRAYATQVEHYPGLVVHGPLIATLLLDLVHRSMPAARVRRFSFRAVSPLFDQARFFVCGKPDAREPGSLHLWAQDEAGMLALEAHALLA
jgi:3-methylfumaryl-CoA hydratase